MEPTDTAQHSGLLTPPPPDARQRPVKSAAALDAFWRWCDARHGLNPAPEPDWEDHLRAIAASRRQRGDEMNVRYYHNPETRLPHIYDHGVEEYEVEDILEDPGETRRGDGDSRVANGQTRNGRYLRVIYTIDPGRRSVFVITSYQLRGKPLAAYRRYSSSRRRRGK